MKSAHETVPVWDDNERAAGFDGSLDSGRQAAAIRAPGRDNVIDLAAWKAANRELWEEPEGFGQEYAEAAPALPARRHRRRAYVDPELFAILGVAGVLAALVARVLVF